MERGAKLMMLGVGMLCSRRPKDGCTSDGSNFLVHGDVLDWLPSFSSLLLRGSGWWKGSGGKIAKGEGGSSREHGKETREARAIFLVRAG